MPSFLIYDIASIINKIFPGETISGLMNLSIEQFFDLATYAIVSIREKNDNAEFEYDTKPLPISQGGWF